MSPSSRPSPPRPRAHRSGIDALTRLCHLLIAAGAPAATLAGGAWHGPIGWTVGLAVVTRLLWGRVGPPAADLARAGRRLASDGSRTLADLQTLSVVGMHGALLALVLTGAAASMAGRPAELAALHRLVVGALLASAALHLGVLAVYHWRHHAGPLRAMVTGQLPGGPETFPTHGAAAIGLVAAVVGLWLALWDEGRTTAPGTAAGTEAAEGFLSVQPRGGSPGPATADDD